MFRSLFWCSVASCVLLSTTAQPIELELVTDDDFGPITDIQSTGLDNRLFVVNRRGIIQIVEDPLGNPRTLRTPFLDISSRVKNSGERGLLGLAFDPNFDSNRFFYLNYIFDDNSVDEVDCTTDEPGNAKNTRISRFSVSSSDTDLAEEASELVIAEIEQPFCNHNGGQLQFGPDGFLYVSVGDGGSGGDPFNASIDLTSMLGKILRVDVNNMDETSVATPENARWNIPPGNPFVNDPDALDEIWAYGVRNPWRISFDRDTGDLWVADVGQNAREEINLVPATSTGGEHYGWDHCEGTEFFDTPLPAGCSCDDPSCFVVPVIEYPHSVGRSVTGGYVYRGTEFSSTLGGTYFYADFVEGDLYRAQANGDGSWSSTISTSLDSPSTFGEDSDGELFVGTLTGSLLRIIPEGPTPRPSQEPTISPMNPPPDTAAPTGSGPNGPDISCPVEYDETTEINALLSLSYTVIIPDDPVDLEAFGGVLCAELVYQGNAWLGFAISTDGQMVGSEAIIGQPGEDVEPNPAKYNLNARSPVGVTTEGAAQTLIDASITQDATSTTLTFGKLLKEPGEIEIDGFGPNTFLWAFGTSNVLGFHAARDSFVLDFSNLSPPTEEPMTASPTVQQTSSPTPVPTTSPTEVPTSEPTNAPTQEPTQSPTAGPTGEPTQAPTSKPTEEPTASPTQFPTSAPTASPTASPMAATTEDPTALPTGSPMASPTVAPSVQTEAPTNEPTATPVTAFPTVSPSTGATATPTSSPVSDPTVTPTMSPSSEPTENPAASPTSPPTSEVPEPTTAEPTSSPTSEPTESPAAEPTVSLTSEPTGLPTPSPTQSPSDDATPPPTSDSARVSQLILTNADDGAEVAVINEGDTFVLDDLPEELTVEAVTEPETVGAVLFVLNGRFMKRETVRPYSLAGKGSGKVFAPSRDLGPGTKTLTVIPFFDVFHGDPDPMIFTTTFTMVQSSEETDRPTGSPTDPSLVESPQVSRFVLIDVDEGVELATINEGDTFDLDQLPPRLTIRAVTEPETIGALEFFLNGRFIKRETVAPYSLAGEYRETGEFAPASQLTVAGAKVLRATLFADVDDGEGEESSTVRFTLQRSRRSKSARASRKYWSR